MGNQEATELKDQIIRDKLFKYELEDFLQTDLFNDDEKSFFLMLRDKLNTLGIKTFRDLIVVAKNNKDNKDHNPWTPSQYIFRALDSDLFYTLSYHIVEILEGDSAFHDEYVEILNRLPTYDKGFYNNTEVRKSPSASRRIDNIITDLYNLVDDKDEL